MPVKPAITKNVKSFGAKGDGVTDDTAAIQNALTSLSAGDWLAFPAGTDVHSAELKVTRPNVVLWSEGAALKGTNPDRQAVMLQANGASIYNFTLTAVTDVRRDAPWNLRIAVFAADNATFWLTGNVIRNNRIIAGGAAGTALQNGASSAGIFVYRATNFLVAENTVQRSPADAIHMTAGSYKGRVLNNIVREPGDDMIAVVSYLGSPHTMFASQKPRSTTHVQPATCRTTSGAPTTTSPATTGAAASRWLAGRTSQPRATRSTSRTMARACT
jgi:hypothetical protein